MANNTAASVTVCFKFRNKSILNIIKGNWNQNTKNSKCNIF